jgi:hypothetical protein
LAADDLGAVAVVAAAVVVVVAVAVAFTGREMERPAG